MTDNSVNIIIHYDKLIDENNDPFHDPEPLRQYMDKWDGEGFINRLKLDKTKSCLEIGVGTGRLAARTSPLCGEFFGIDISPKTAFRAGENLKNFKNVTIICADFLEYDFNRKFDVIYSSLTFMHFEDKGKAFERIRSVLAPGGLLVLSTDKNGLNCIDAGYSVIKVYPDTPEEISRIAGETGFKIMEHFQTEFADIFVMSH